MGFFLKKYPDFGGEKKIIWFRVSVYNLMLNSWKKIRALRDKKKNILILVLSEKKILNETKNHNPPLQVLNGRSLSEPYGKSYYQLLWNLHWDQTLWKVLCKDTSLLADWTKHGHQRQLFIPILFSLLFMTW